MTAALAERLDLDTLDRGLIHKLWVQLVDDGLSRPMAVPVLVARGRRDGPVLGVTAAVHGNELNGIPTIHRLLRAIDPAELKGTVVAVPVVNVPGYLSQEREFLVGEDLNRLFPGAPDGNGSQVFAWRFVHRIVRQFHYLIDLHTASFGRVNSFYVRADMTHPITHKLAHLISPQIIVHNEGADGTLRAAANGLGIHAITVEIGDPQRFQRGLIRSSRLGIQAVMEHLEMYDHDDAPLEEATLECARSYWMYTDAGGALQVLPDVTDRVRAGDPIAVVTNLFGDVIREYRAPEAGVVIGKSTNPVAQTGARILHLGIEGRVEPSSPPPRG